MVWKFLPHLNTPSETDYNNVYQSHPKYAPPVVTAAVSDTDEHSSSEKITAEDSDIVSVALGVTEEKELEYRDEAGRPWWKFFDEYEYRLNKQDRCGQKWFKWFDENDTPAERKLIWKLDILLSCYAFLIYWVKFLDQTNLNNAYVAGLSDDVHFKGNDLVNTQAIFSVGAIVFQLPFMFLLPKVPLHIVLPLLDFCWGIMTLCQYKMNNVGGIQAMRFLVGAFEASLYPALHYLLGSWFKPKEINRRAGFMYLAQFFGVLTSSVIAAGAVKHLDGVNGLEGWRWLFIIDGIITMPIGIIGLWMIPGTPEKCYSIFLSKEEVVLARERLKDHKERTSGEPPKPKYSFGDRGMWKKIFSSWQIYVLCLEGIFCWNNNNGTSGAYLLWLKSLKNSEGEQRYTNSKVNDLGAITPGLGMVWIVLTVGIADLFGSRWGAIVFTQLFNFTGNTILAVWDVPEGAKWFAWMLQYFGWAMAATMYSWLNDICRHDPQVRAIILMIMNMMAQTSTAWISVLVWKTSEAPRYLKGFTFTACSAFCLMIWTMVVLYFYKRDERQHAKENGIVLYNSSTGEGLEHVPETIIEVKPHDEKAAIKSQAVSIHSA
ncbi:Permease, putative [Yarrowia lipolytica]|nr:Permease, putative [Yarrowia lipolytica]